MEWLPFVTGQTLLLLFIVESEDVLKNGRESSFIIFSLVFYVRRMTIDTEE